jgi:hypothetical protein
LERPQLAEPTWARSDDSDTICHDHTPSLDRPPSSNITSLFA